MGERRGGRERGGEGGEASRPCSLSSLAGAHNAVRNDFYANSRLIGFRG